MPSQSSQDGVREIISPLFTNENDILKRLVDKSLQLFRIEGSTGEMVLGIPRSKITDKDFIGLLLVTRYLACRAGLSKRDSMTLPEIAEASGITEGTISPRLSDLKADRIAEGIARGEYRISYANAERFLEDIIFQIQKPQTATARVESPSQSNSPEGAYPKIDRPKGVRDGIMKVLATSWGEKPRTWREINEALKSNGHYFGEGNVSGSLTQLFKELKKVRRVSIGNKNGYVLADR